MSGQDGPSRAPEHAAVRSIEAILGPRRQRYPAAVPPSKGTLEVSRALWICACVSMEDAPTWLLYDTAEHGVAWCRVPDGVEPLDLVHTRLGAGGHADPDQVLLWLQGTVPDPWAEGGYGDGDDGVVDDLRREVRTS